MEYRISVIFFLLATWSCFGQVRTIGKIYVDGRELEIVAHGPPYFEFNEFDTTLTKAAQEYLDDFGKDYSDSLLARHQFLIELTPGLTAAEQKKNKDLGVKRLKVIMNYLERNYRIDRTQFKARYSETITNDGCVAFLVKEKGRKKITRKERRRMKMEEDSYFKSE